MWLFGRRKKEKLKAKQNQEQVQESTQKEVQTESTGEMQDAVLTIYACKANIQDIPNIIQELFKDETDHIEFESEWILKVTLKDKTFIKFFIHADINENMTQAIGMANFFSQAPLENEAVKKSALNQIISIDGKTDYETFNVQICSDVLDKDIEPSENDIARKERSLKVLKEKGIPYIEHLQLAALEAETELQEEEEILKRLLATFTACVQSEVYTCGRYEDPADKMKEQLERLDEQYGVKKYFSITGIMH